MAAHAEMTRQEEFLRIENQFRRNAFLIINKMVELSPEHPSVLVDEILHSIFFLGKINQPPFSPQSIVTDEEMLNALKGLYPRPFELHPPDDDKKVPRPIPKRSPISCVLDMIVHLTGPENEDEIITRMQELILQLKEDEATHLVSSVICVSQKDKDPKSDRYYGVSMSTSRALPGRIMVAASCLSAWHSHVAGAVMTYYPQKEKKTYFDGTIKLPEQVRCQAFNFSQGKEMPPCKSCGNLFGLSTTELKIWAYGNCAEPESVSNLLKKEKEVREQAQPTSETCTAENRQKAEKSVLKDLTGFLNTLKFKWDSNFYTPQV